MLLLIISFIAGVLTILAPCVLPLLPVIIGGAMGQTADRSRPYVITAALAISLVGFTLLLKTSTALIGLSPAVLNYVSGGLLIALGLVAVVPEVWEWLMIHVGLQAASDRLLDHSGHNRRRFIGPILTGIALGPVFASCSPTYAFILASVLPRSFTSGLFYLAAYIVGLAGALLAAAIAGRGLTSRLGWATNTHSLFRRLFGVVFILIGLAVASGSEISIEVWVANHLPFDEAHLEQMLLSSQAQPNRRAGAPDGVLNLAAAPAPAFRGLTNWINSQPLTLAGLRGKVVLVDFWTYSCVNCIRSLPYVEKWYTAYAHQGLVVIGVSTPEFAFEHNPANVRSAVAKDGITYPVALDNNYDTWNAFNTNSWPTEYLIDRNGNLRYVSSGEGDYPTTEKAIQRLLGLNESLRTPTSNVPIAQDQTPETYFGTSRGAEFFGSPGLANGTATYTPTTDLDLNEWTLAGRWSVADESITSAGAGATLTIKTQAKDIYMVAGSQNNQPRTVSVGLGTGGGQAYGPDAPAGRATISAPRLYHIVSLPQAGSSTVMLTVPTGVSLYTFTFGS